MEKRYRKYATQVYFSYIRSRFIINTNIKRHKHECPLQIKKKIFLKLKYDFRQRQQTKRYLLVADKHHKERMVKNAFAKGLLKYYR